jgi:hypothetical protein
MLAAALLARCGALRSAAARAAQACLHAPLPAQHCDGHAAPLLAAAARCSGRHARTATTPLPQGFACRGLASGADAASGGDAAAPDAARKRVRSVGVYGEKNAAGRPLLDRVSVAFLVWKRVYDNAARVENLLYTRLPSTSRYPFEVVKAAYTWLEAALAGCSKRVDGSDVAGVTLAVRKLPTLLLHGVATLQRSWDFLQAPAPDGLGFSRDQAFAAVISKPAVLFLTPERMKRTVTTLAELGVANAPAALLRFPNLLGLSSERLHATAAVLCRHGLDTGDVIRKHPHVLGLRADALEAKLRWLLHVACCTPAYLQKNSILLTLSLHGRMRPRFFIAMQLGVLGRSKFEPLMHPADAVFLKRQLRGTPAASCSVEAYKQHIASPEFVRYMDVGEAALREQHAATG